MDEQQEKAAVAETPRKISRDAAGVRIVDLHGAGGWAVSDTFVFQNYVIPSGSMEKTLLVGDHVFVDRITLAPETRWAPFVHYRDVRRGDIIVFMKPNPETPDLVLVKRAIGIPGDRIHLEHGLST